ncbi:hypothetical protein [Fluviispira sanaruensis]|uniref:Uncharacterized protein n=1 Tax=Fluviispira sanaruensis TaxID=2493639 RepID=A0A4P2VHS6_FLUSA|nr:hypothetical protein [Fluviispira sanaruensis]BBH51878.1 hypothetical protein JCM31447_03030 [Fluviispira sanaruensis]
MLFKKIIFAFLCNLPMIFIANDLYADETYIICSNPKGDWNWLEYGNIKVNGTWKIKYQSPSLNFKYFILDSGVDTYAVLKKKCIDEFNGEFIYPQPVLSFSNKWAPFAKDEHIILPGLISYFEDNFRLRVNFKNNQ